VKFFLIILVFISGMTSLALEMCASRLLAAYFGTSLFILANLIGLILVYLTIGYFIGGRLADRYPSEQVLCTITAMAALSISILPFISQVILTWSITGLEQVSVSNFFSSLLGTILLFAVPVTLLGLVSPFEIRLVTKEVGRSGKTSGSLYAISTLGSILGAFLPVLWLIPAFGVRSTLLIFGVILFAVSLWGLRPRWRPAFSLVLIALVLPLGPLKNVPDLIYEQESLYNYIQVTQLPDGTRELILNEGQAILSIYYPNPKTVLTDRYMDYFLYSPYFTSDSMHNNVHRVAIIRLYMCTSSV